MSSFKQAVTVDRGLTNLPDYNKMSDPIEAVNNQLLDKVHKQFSHKGCPMSKKY